ncbi:MAG: hypothetical protein OXG60_01055, partial [Chloroflexi bacterium]|nr:hypothetical protein [Chloroflexota bacterium]
MQEKLNTEDTELAEKNQGRSMFCGRFAETPLQFVSFLILITYLQLLRFLAGDLTGRVGRVDTDRRHGEIFGWLCWRIHGRLDEVDECAAGALGAVPGQGGGHDGVIV